MEKVSVVILSRSSNEDEFNMTLNCIRSLVKSENTDKISFEVILVESNRNFKDSDFEYPDFVEVIVPQEEFNFHRFLNIGIKNSTGSFIALCNNDIIFKKNWMTNILTIKNKYPEILSFCPVDYNFQYTPPEKFENIDQHYVLGYNVRTHIVGFCIVADRKLFDIIGPLDERFDFYYADDDYSMTLRKHNIKHALVLNAEVRHLGGVVTNNKRDEGQKVYTSVSDEEVENLPEYLKQPGRRWLLKNKKMLEGHLIFHEKWGSLRSIAIKNKLFNFLSFFNQDYLINRLYRID